jgi:hypothetical protein
MDTGLASQQAQQSRLALLARSRRMAQEVASSPNDYPKTHLQPSMTVPFGWR